MMAQLKTQFATTQDSIHRITKPLHGAVVCPNCGSTDVEVVPSVFVRSMRYTPSSCTGSRLVCKHCRTASKLAAEVEVSLAEYVLEDTEGLFVAEEAYAARLIVDKAKRGLQ